MTNPGRLRSARRNQRSASQMIVAGLLALAVVASLFLIFSESVQLLRVGLIAALWAATVGALAMTKYRRESALDKAKVGDLQMVYELQLEREISARREYELTVEQRVRTEVRADSDELAALRTELGYLRMNLEALFDGSLQTERIALRADSTRVQELGGGSNSSHPPATPDQHIPGAGHIADSRDQSGDNQYSAVFADEGDDPVTAETSIVESSHVGYADYSPPEVQPEPVPAPEPQPVQEFEPATVSRHGRRRELEDEEASGAHSNGLSVAEIMANMASESGSAQRTGRRRRAE
ncbi:DUF6779 domain-containing protein [Rhodococcus marinonascens]|uniref:DUF6779 domain-containing protein n=1 Tax=Rhodococcus marinonascens TaxID=38311 RepID=UPI00157CA551|nr:DUF6779 domain-containing protein [Rhodococcus marinonascens]